MPTPEEKELPITPMEEQVVPDSPYQRAGGGKGNADDFTVNELNVRSALRAYRDGIILKTGKGVFASPKVSSKATALNEMLRFLVEETNEYGVLGLPLSDVLVIKDQGDTNDLGTIKGPLATGVSGIGMMDFAKLLMKLPQIARASVEGVIDEEGLMYYDATNDVIRWYDGNSWKTLGSGSYGEVYNDTNKNRTLTNAAQRYLVGDANGIGSNGISTSDVTPDHANWRVSLTAGGDYKATLTVSFEVDTAGKLQFDVAVGGSALENITCEIDCAANTLYTISISGIFTWSSGSISPYVQTNQAGTVITYERINLHVNSI